MPLVLVVDDAPDVLSRIHALLRPHYQVKVALTGAKGLRLASAQPTPDVILLDVMMADIDGYAVCRQLKQQDLTRDIPVLFLTARDELEMEEKGFALGAADYITKPISPGVLLARIKTQLAASAQRRSLQGMFEDVIDYAPVMFLLADQHLRIVRTNVQADQHLGYGRGNLVGQDIRQVLPSAEPHLRAARVQLQSEPGAARIDANPELLALCQDGSRLPVAATFGQLETPQGLLHTVVLVNMTERLATLQQLTQSQDRLRALAALTEHSRENERKAMAREVHDELGQVLSALRMGLSLLPMQWNGELSQLETRVQALKALADHAIGGVRNLVTVLRPEALNLGLLPAIEWLRDEFVRHHAVHCAVRQEGSVQSLDESRAMVIYRIIQESLTNVGRYARATDVQIQVAFAPEEVKVQVTDNGCGFDPGAVLIRKTFGLLGMRERALALGGTLRVQSSPGRGTTIALRVPLQGVAVEGAP